MTLLLNTDHMNSQHIKERKIGGARLFSSYEPMETTKIDRHCLFYVCVQHHS